MKKYFTTFLCLLAGLAFTAKAQQASTTNSLKPATQQSAEAKMAANNKVINPAKPVKKDPKRVQMATMQLPKRKATGAPTPATSPSGK